MSLLREVIRPPDGSVDIDDAVFTVFGFGVHG